MASAVVGSSTSTLHVQRAIVAGVLGAGATWIIGAVMSMLGLVRAELISITGIQVLAISWHKNENAVGTLGLLLTLLFGGFVVGIAFGLVRQRFHGNLEWTGVIFGVVCWLIAQIIFIPLLGSIEPVAGGAMMDPVPGLFSMGAGIVAPIGSLVAHILFGVIAGEIYEPHEELH